MTYIVAQDMIPGKTYRGTAEGPEQLDGAVFDVLAIVAFAPEGPQSLPTDDDLWLVQVQYDAWALPLPETTSFSPFDIVEVMA